MPGFTIQGVYIEEAPLQFRAIIGLATTITVLVGWAPQGPKDQAVPLQDWNEYVRIFGGLDARSYLGYAVRHFFTNGGSMAYIVRVVAGDSTTVLNPNESSFENAVLPVNGTGCIHLLDQIDLFNLLCVPGETNPVFLGRLATFCHDRRAFLIADSAADANVNTFADTRNNQTLITGPAAANAAVYFPWIAAPDPKQNNAARNFPPCGFMAGIYARTDTQRSVWKAPAGTEAVLIGASSPACKLSDAANCVLTPKAINSIRTQPGFGTVAWGARTQAGAEGIVSEWKYVPIRRTALFIEESLYRGLQWTAFEPNNEPLWAQIRRNIDDFMHNLFRQGAFQGQTPKDAYFVKCDATTTTQNDINQGVINLMVGFAPLKPAEFVLIKCQLHAGQ